MLTLNELYVVTAHIDGEGRLFATRCARHAIIAVRFIGDVARTRERVSQRQATFRSRGIARRRLTSVPSRAAVKSISCRTSARRSLISERFLDRIYRRSWIRWQSVSRALKSDGESPDRCGRTLLMPWSRCWNLVGRIVPVHLGSAMPLCFPRGARLPLHSARARSSKPTRPMNGFPSPISKRE